MCRNNYLLITPYLYSPTLQTRLDLYNSELALASSPVLFWNLCVQLEIWISIVICRLAAVVGQASNAPPPHSASSLSLRDSCQLRKSSINSPPPPVSHQCCQVPKKFPASTSKKFGQFRKKFGQFPKTLISLCLIQFQCLLKIKFNFVLVYIIRGYHS